MVRGKKRDTSSPRRFYPIRSIPNVILYQDKLDSGALASTYADLQLGFETSPVDALFQLVHSVVLHVQRGLVVMEALAARQSLNKHLPSFNWS